MAVRLTLSPLSLLSLLVAGSVPVLSLSESPAPALSDTPPSSSTCFVWSRCSTQEEEEEEEEEEQEEEEEEEQEEEEAQQQLLVAGQPPAPRAGIQ